MAPSSLSSPLSAHKEASSQTLPHLPVVSLGLPSSQNVIWVREGEVQLLNRWNVGGGEGSWSEELCHKDDPILRR